MSQSFKVVIPMAGWGTRMRPHTWSKPKPLITVAGKPSLDHMLEMFTTLPDAQNTEYIFIISPFLGEQIPPYIKEHYPDMKAHFVMQTEMKGQSHALWTARRYLEEGPMIMVFSDTLLETDFSFLAEEQSDGVAWVKAVPDPRRFGVVELDPDGWITKLVEKPTTLESNLVVVGCYYFKDARKLLAAIRKQIRRGMAFKEEYYLTGAINLMLERGAKMRTHQVDVWLDTGTIPATLETNRFLLDHGRSNNPSVDDPETKIIPPVFIHPLAKINKSTIGPYASIGPNCVIQESRIEDSILEDDVQVNGAALVNSIVGNEANIQGRSNGHSITVLIGDNSSIQL
jgi:glucose-1-phosphate thymidylyltransferase